MGRGKILRTLPERIDDVKLASAIESAINMRVPIQPMPADVGDSIDAGLLDAKVITVGFNVAPNTDVVVDHQLRREPTLCMIALPEDVPGNSAVRIYLSAGNTLAFNTAAKIPIDATSFDYLSEFDTTSLRYIALVPGVRQVMARASITGAATAEGYMHLMLYKNGAEYSRGIHLQRSKTIGAIQDLSLMDGVMIVDDVYMDVGDYLELYGYQNFRNPSATLNPNSNLTYMSVQCVQGFEISKGSTWDDEQVSFKCNGDTSGNVLTVQVIIA